MIPQGWAWPAGARGEHYFVQVTGRRIPRSLCENWLWAGPLRDEDRDTTACAVCKRRLKGRRARGNTEEEKA